MTPAAKMSIETALGYLSRETAIELLWCRMFVNADETINVIAEHDIRKQMPRKALKSSLTGTSICPSCERFIYKYEHHHGMLTIPYCKWCGQRIDWEERTISKTETVVDEQC